MLFTAVQYLIVLHHYDVINLLRLWIRKKTVNQKFNYLKVEIELRNQQTIEIALNAK